MYFLVGRQEMISNFWLMEKWENFIQHFHSFTEKNSEKKCNNFPNIYQVVVSKFEYKVFFDEKNLKLRVA